MVKNKNFEDLFDRYKSSAEILKEEDEKEKIDLSDINSWKDYFTTVFDGSLKYPKNASCIARWHMPSYYKGNKTGQDLQIPILTILEDDSDKIWLLYLTNPTELHWKFLMLTPNKDILLSYLRSEKSLLEVYSTTPKFYFCTPDYGSRMLEFSASELDKNLIPKSNSYYDNNIWFDQSDIYSGMNVAPYNKIFQFAKFNKFFWY